VGSDISLKGGIIAGAAGGAVFLLFLLPLDFGIIISIIAAAGAFAAAYFIARGQNGEEMKIDLGVDRAVYDAVLKDGVRKTTELRKHVSRMKAGDAKENALKICGFADRIVQDVTDDPKDARAASQFMNC